MNHFMTGNDDSEQQEPGDSEEMASSTVTPERVTRRPFTVRIPDELYKRLGVYSAETDQSLQDLTEIAIASMLAADPAAAARALNPLGDVKPHELKRLRGFLRLLREGPEQLQTVAVKLVEFYEKKAGEPE